MDQERKFEQNELTSTVVDALEHAVELLRSTIHLTKSKKDHDKINKFNSLLMRVKEEKLDLSLRSRLE